MPIISVKIAQGRSIEKKQELAEAITREVVRVLDVQPKWVTILIDEYARENWASAGELHAIKFGPGFGSQGTKNK